MGHAKAGALCASSRRGGRRRFQQSALPPALVLGLVPFPRSGALPRRVACLGRLKVGLHIALVEEEHFMAHVALRVWGEWTAAQRGPAPAPTCTRAPHWPARCARGR